MTISHQIGPGVPSSRLELSSPEFGGRKGRKETPASVFCTSAFPQGKQIAALSQVFNRLQTINSTGFKMHCCCCVPGCKADSKKSLQKYPFMRGVTFHSFPHKVRAKRLRKVWINMVRRENTWAPNRHTYICSRHFEGGQGPTDEHPIPTIFPWNTPATSRPTSALSKLEQGRLEIRNTANVSMGRSLLTNVALYRGVVGEVVVSTEQRKEAKGVGKHNVLLPQDVVTPTCAVGDHTYSTSSKTRITTSDMGCQTDISGEELQQMINEHGKMKAKLEDRDSLRRDVFIEKVTSTDASISSYTGLPNLGTLMSLFEILDKNTDNLQYWNPRTKSKGCEEQGYTGRKPGPKRKLNNFQEYILTLVKFRLALTGFMMADLFGISETRVSQIFITWINFMYHTFGALVRWPSREEIDAHMPIAFKNEYPQTRVIIDCSEFFCERPDNPDAHHTHYSDYKHHTTHKVLLGISPSGAFTFVSDVWGGNVSDEYITRESGLIDLLEPGDDVMAERGFDIQDLLIPKGATLNAPPFTRKCKWGKGKSLNATEVAKTKSIAQVRIHVKRAIQRLKRWKMLSHVMPVSAKPYMNQMVRLGAFFSNLLKPLVEDK